MRAVVQRVTRGSVTVNGARVAEIGPGLVVLLGVGHADTQQHADWMAEKIANLRIFEDEAGKMNRSVLETGGAVIVVSQFTLYADAQKGRRPSFVDAAPPEIAEPLVAYFVEKINALGVPVQTGTFRAEMLVEIHNDGPVTIVLDRL
ncbi:MAG: D-aminoacyl-tRNA deacylase [Anaerolineales bacterium]